jgi:hypothetical protein
LEGELDKLGVTKKSSELVGMSQSDKDAYIQSLLKEISDLKKQLGANTSHLNEGYLEEFDGINVDDSNEIITLRPPDDDDSDEDNEGFDSSNILNILGSFMNNDMLTSDPSNVEKGNSSPVNPMLKIFAKMIEGMGENMQSGENPESEEEDNSNEVTDSTSKPHEKLE